MNKETNEIIYRNAHPDDYRSVWELLCEVGWGKHISDYERYCKMIENSDRAYVAIEALRVVGFGRALCDNASVGYITMVAVSPDKRRKGIGNSIVKMLIGDDPDIKWVLTSAAESNLFWQKHGFRVMDGAMEKPRERDIKHKSVEEILDRKMRIKSWICKRIRKICNIILSYLS